MYIILFNPLSRSGKNAKVLKKLQRSLDDESKVVNVLEIDDMPKFFDFTEIADKLILFGGDGTIHYSVNFLADYSIKQEVLLYSSGTGNDFLRNIGGNKELMRINEFFSNLPYIQNDVKKQYFVNGVGMGLDALVCKYVNESYGKSSLNYKLRALKAIFKYKPSPVRITIDDEVYEYNKCWFVSIMNGVYQGGGMKFAPDAIINDGSLDVCLLHSCSRIGVIKTFLKIFKGRHKKDRNILLKKGKKISVAFASPVCLQEDGEVTEGISKIDVFA